MRRRRLGVGVGGVVAAVLCAAAAARGEEPQGAAAGVGRDGSCELPHVTDRSKVSSLRCVACHDGSTGEGAVFEMRGGGARGLGMSHPVEVDYADAFARDPQRYVPEVHLPPEVPLVAGKVTCTSCHDGASPNAKRVANPMQLCYACHRM